MQKIDKQGSTNEMTTGPSCTDQSAAITDFQPFTAAKPSAGISASLTTGYKVNACIDWIELEFDFGKNTQFQWVQKELREILEISAEMPDAFVKPIDPGPGKVTSNFAIRFFDDQANDVAVLQDIAARLSKKFGGDSQQVRITAIEIALDFYVRAGRGDLTALTRRLQNTLSAKGNARQFDPDWGNIFLEDTGGRVDPSFNLRVGNKTDPLSWQIYYKVTNAAKQLKADQHRARAEFTLQGTALQLYGIDTLVGMEDFKFEKLGRLLHFRHLKSIAEICMGTSKHFEVAVRGHANPEKLPLCSFPIGWGKYHRDRRDGRLRNRGLPVALKHNRYSVADDELNRLVRKKFSALSKRFSRNKSGRNSS